MHSVSVSVCAVVVALLLSANNRFVSECSSRSGGKRGKRRAPVWRMAGAAWPSSQIPISPEGDNTREHNRCKSLRPERNQARSCWSRSNIELPSPLPSCIRPPTMGEYMYPHGWRWRRLLAGFRASKGSTGWVLTDGYRNECIERTVVHTARPTANGRLRWWVVAEVMVCCLVTIASEGLDIPRAGARTHTHYVSTCAATLGGLNYSAVVSAAGAS
uniref:Putative secreted protein n=1 Tax=Anopheles darlingi TaxID=43151 RepID=A0A2M4D8Z8_ANODA